MIYKRGRTYFLVIIFSSLLSVGFGQTYNFRNFNEDNGLPQGYIYHISQDKNGYLYSSTGEGLAIFGGVSFKTIGRAQGLPENFITTHFIDSKNNIWIGHYQEGVSVYNRSRGTLIEIDCPELKNVRINCITEDPHGNIWIGTFGKGIFLVDPQLNARRLPHVKPENVNSILVTPDEDIIVADNEGAYVYQMNKKNQVMELLQSIDSLDEHKTVDMVLSPDSSLIWLAVSGKGIASIKKTRGNYYINSMIIADLSMKEYDFRSISIDAKNNLWVATFGEGVRKIAFADNEGYSYTVSSYTQKNGLINDYIQSIYNDYEGNVWIGTYGNGLVQLVDEKFIFFHTSTEENESPVYTVSADKIGNLWLGSNKGLRSFNTTSAGSTEQLFDSKNGFVTDKVTTIYCDKTGLLWIGTANNGIYTLDPQSKKINNISAKFSLDKKHINYITGNAEQIYIATTGGLYIYKLENSAITTLETNDGLLHNNIYHVFADRFGKVWLASHGSTIYNYFNGKITSFKDIPELKSFNINSITEDRSGRIWFVTEGDGAFAYDGSTFHNYSVADGMASNYCYSVVCDKDGNIWIGHKNGLSRKSETARNFVSYSKHQGILSPELCLNATYLDAAGNIWFGTAEGLIKYDKEKDRINSREPSTLISGLTINNTYSSLKPDTVLPFKNYSIKFDFIGICLTQPENVRYRYILEGFETEWNDAEARSTTASYPKLEDGNYTFKLVAQNNDGVWNSIPVTYSFSISKPLWKKWWFFLLAFAITSFVVFIIIRWRTRSLVRLSMRLEHMVDEKTFLLKKEKENVEKINSVVEEQNRDITDSINYAKKIQEAMLPTKKQIIKKINAFIFYQPRDIVSGDFYWYSESDGKLVIAAVDCTGHGVPGAFMSLIGSTLLSKIVNDHAQTKPSIILKMLNQNVTESLHQDAGQYSTKDGMEMALCAFNLPEKKVVFSGAGRPLIFIRNKQMREFGGSAFSVGGAQDTRQVTYEEHEIALESGDMIYLFTDGFADQFGGERNRKYSSRRLKELLVEISDLDTPIQEKRLEEALENWKGDSMQIDDILVMGIKI